MKGSYSQMFLCYVAVCFGKLLGEDCPSGGEFLCWSPTNDISMKGVAVQLAYI